MKKAIYSIMMASTALLLAAKAQNVNVEQFDTKTAIFFPDSEVGANATVEFAFQPSPSEKLVSLNFLSETYLIDQQVYGDEKDCAGKKIFDSESTKQNIEVNQSDDINLLIEQSSIKYTIESNLHFYNQKQAVKRYSQITVNSRLCSSKTVKEGDFLIMDFFGDTHYRGKILNMHVNINGTVTISGQIANFDNSWFMITTTDERTLAHVSIPEMNEYYQIISDPVSHNHYLIEHDKIKVHKPEKDTPMMPKILHDTDNPDDFRNIQNVTTVAPMIYVFPWNLNHTLPIGGSAWGGLAVFNFGSDTLFADILIDFTPENEKGEVISKDSKIARQQMRGKKPEKDRSEWITLSDYYLEIPAGWDYFVEAWFDASNLNPGTYYAEIDIFSNDPENSLIIVPVTLQVFEPPVISVTPDYLEENLMAGETSTKTLTISNDGGVNLNWSLTIQSLAKGIRGKKELKPDDYIIQADGNNIKDGVLIGGSLLEYETPSHNNTLLNRTITNHKLNGTLIDFDDLSAPCNFIQTFAVTNEYLSSGVAFVGDGNNGGAVINECGNFEVVGYSSPNFLAFNINAPYGNGGIPQGPQTILFTNPVSYVEFFAGHANAGEIIMETFGIDDNLLTTSSIFGSNTLRPLSASVPGIKKVVVSFTGTTLVIDDLFFSDSWLFSTSTSGNIPPGSSETIAITFDATSLTSDVYAANVNIFSNDLENPVLTVSVTLTVVDPENYVIKNLTVDSGDDVCRFGLATVIASDVFVANGGILSLSAGQSVTLLPSFVAEDGSELYVFISENNPCILTRSFISSNDDYYVDNLHELVSVSPKLDVRLYPNPSKGICHVNLINVDNLSQVLLEVYEIMGSKIKQEIVRGHSDIVIDLSRENNGLYFVRITNANESITLKLIRH